MADIVLTQAQSIPPTMRTTYKDMGNGTHALVVAAGGSTLSTIAVDTALARAHFEGEKLVYPSLAAGVAVVSANADWEFGAYATVIPENVIDAAFHIRGVSIESCDRNAVFQLELYKYPEDEVVTAIRFAVAGGILRKSSVHT